MIIAMGIHLAHIHDRENVLLVSADYRLTKILAKCDDGLPAATRKKLKLTIGETKTGKKFAPETFPHGVNLAITKTSDLEDIFGSRPLTVGTMPKVYRHLDV